MKKVKPWAMCIGLVALFSLFAGNLGADPCLVVYPEGPCVYHYDSEEYYTVDSRDPLYDPLYDRGGLVLLEVGTNEVDLSIYQAPGLMGFAPSTDGNEGYFFTGTDCTIIIDGFSNQPTTYSNVLLMFDKIQPKECVPDIWVEGELLTTFVYNTGDIVVSTPTPYGNNYSDTVKLSMSWRGCYGVHIWAFSDENYNGSKDGGECFTAFSHDLTIPVEKSSWSGIKEQPK